MKQAPVNIKNKRATFDYELIDTYTAGIVLTGTEIKSIRLGKASLVDTFCYFANGELWVKNMHVAEYFYGSYNNPPRAQVAAHPQGAGETGAYVQGSRLHHRARPPLHQREGIGQARRGAGQRQEAIRQTRSAEGESRQARHGTYVQTIKPIL